MGQAKDKLIKEEDDWDKIAREKGYICGECGFVIPKSEYSASSNLCGRCRNKAQKDD